MLTHPKAAHRNGLELLGPGASVAAIYVIALSVTAAVLERALESIALFLPSVLLAAIGAAAARRWGSDSRAFVLGGTSLAVVAGVLVAALAL